MLILNALPEALKFRISFINSDGRCSGETSFPNVIVAPKLEAITLPWNTSPFSRVGVGATVTVVNFLVGNQRVAIIESIDITLQTPAGLPVMTFNITRNGIPIPEVGANFNVDHPFDTVVARDVRGINNDQFLITATNGGIAPFTVFVRIVGYDFGLGDVGDLTDFYQDS